MGLGLHRGPEAVQSGPKILELHNGQARLAVCLQEERAVGEPAQSEVVDLIDTYCAQGLGALSSPSLPWIPTSAHNVAASEPEGVPVNLLCSNTSAFEEEPTPLFFFFLQHLRRTIKYPLSTQTKKKKKTRVS